MRRALYACVLLAVMWTGPLLPAQTKFTESRTTLEKWVETRQLISQEREEWRTDKQNLQDLIALLEKEKQLLTEQIAKAEATATQVDKEREKLIAENESLSVAAGAIRTSVTQLEKRVLELYKAFPPPLRERIDPLFKRVPTTPTVHLSLGERMQNVIGILSEADKFNGAVTLVSEVKKNEAGQEVSVRTMYLGLGTAYYVDRAGTTAGYGVAGPEGWEWTSRNDLAGRITRAIHAYENPAAAEFIQLPVTVK